MGLGGTWRHPLGYRALVLVGALSHSGAFRAWITSIQDQPHLVEGIDQVLRRLGGTARRWRVDRMATVIFPGTGRLQSSFVPVAKHYGVGVDPCPQRHPQRKGVVEKASHYISQRWWRTAMVNSLAQAQTSLEWVGVGVGQLTNGATRCDRNPGEGPLAPGRPHHRYRV